MTPEPLAGTPAAPASAPLLSGPKPKIDPRFIAPIFISFILLVAHFGYGGLKSPFHTGAAIVTAIILEAILGKLTYGKVPNLASAYVSGISAGILVRSEEIWPFALTAAIAITSKYVLRWKGRHLWNPTNFAIGAMLVVAHEHMATLSAELGNNYAAFLVVTAIGCVIVGKLKKLHICATYALAFVFFAWVRSLVTGHPFLAELAPITGPMYMLFTFFMITDPKTTVHSVRGQVVVAFLIAAVECGLRLGQNIHAPYYALFTVGPIANVIDIWWLERHKKAKATT